VSDLLRIFAQPLPIRSRITRAMYSPRSSDVVASARLFPSGVAVAADRKPIHPRHCLGLPVQRQTPRAPTERTRYELGLLHPATVGRPAPSVRDAVRSPAHHVTRSTRSTSMPSGGHARSGPAPDPTSLRSGAAGSSGGWTRMTEPPQTPPAWPLGTPTDAEAALWADVWSRPPASLWERFGLARDVATYVRTALGFEREGHTNAALGGLTVRPIPEGRAAPLRRPMQPAPSAGCGAVAWSLRTGSGEPADHAIKSAHSPQKVRNSASIGHCRPTTPNDETAGQVNIPSMTARSRASRVSSGSTSRQSSWRFKATGRDGDFLRRRTDVSIMQACRTS
jgi:hypothetical protein